MPDQPPWVVTSATFVRKSADLVARIEAGLTQTEVIADRTRDAVRDSLELLARIDGARHAPESPAPSVPSNPAPWSHEAEPA